MPTSFFTKSIYVWLMLDSKKYISLSLNRVKTLLLLNWKLPGFTEEPDALPIDEALFGGKPCQHEPWQAQGWSLGLRTAVGGPWRQQQGGGERGGGEGYIAMHWWQRWPNTVFWTEYEYYSESEFWPNTNTNNIRFFQNERIRIRIIFVHKYLAEYEYE